MRIGYCTIANTNDLSQVQVLEYSLHKFHPELDFHILLCESPEACNTVSAKTGRDFLTPAEVNCANWQQMAFYYDMSQFSTALKPFLLETLMNQGYDAVIYLDPNIEIYGRLDDLHLILNDHNAVLTPYVCRPVSDDGKKPTMDDYARAGQFNLGFIAISANNEVRELLRWWQSVMVDGYLFDKANHFNLDQFCAASIPSFLEKTFILRDPAYNMAYWNIFQRKLENNGEMWITDSGELKFFHFFGICHQDLTRISVHQDRVSAPIGTPLHNLLTSYFDKIQVQPWAIFRNHTYSFAFYYNGEPITIDERKAFLGMKPHERTEIGNPFETNNSPQNVIRIRCKELLDQTGGQTDWIGQYKQEKLIATIENIKLGAAIQQYRLAHYPVIGPIIRSITNFNTSSSRYLVEELLATDDKTFLNKTYNALLGRMPDPKGLENYSKRLRKGMSKKRVLDRICMSAEYRSKMKCISG